MSWTSFPAALAAISAVAAPLGAQLPSTLTPDDVARARAETLEVASERRSVILRETGPARDPVRSEAYPTGVALYIQSDGAYSMRFHLHAQEAAAEPVLRRAARFLAAVWLVARARVGPDWLAVTRKPVEVWLTRSRPGGGAGGNGSITLFEALAPRTDLEWARTLAHEYGHVVFPGAGGYLEPEPWSNGILGERLILGWLRDDLLAGRLSPAGAALASQAELDYYHERQVQPLLDAATDAWPDEATVSGRNKQAMNAFTGLMLAIDRSLGARALFGLLDALADGSRAEQDGPAFLAAFRLWLQRQSEFSLNRVGREAQAFWLPAGRYRVSGAGLAPTVTPGAVAPSGSEWLVTLQRSGPVTLRWVGSGPLRWTRLK